MYTRGLYVIQYNISNVHSAYLLVMSETSKDDWNRSSDEEVKGDYLPSQLAQIEATDLTFDIGEKFTTKYVRLFYI